MYNSKLNVPKQGGGPVEAGGQHLFAVLCLYNQTNFPGGKLLRDHVLVANTSESYWLVLVLSWGGVVGN